MNSKTKLIIVIALLLINVGCGVKIQEGSGATPTLSIVTATLPPSATLAPTYTPLPPPPTSTLAPVEGIASTQINVRAQPSTAGEVLGIVAANAKIQIIGKDPGGSWWQILYPASIDGKGWVTAQYVTTAGKPDVPVIGGSSATNPSNGNVAIVQQQLNVRSGPGTDFNSLGTLNPEDVVNLIGKDANGAWLQIEFSSGPEGKGWINSAFAQATGVENLPIITEAGVVVGTGTPTGIPPSPTATVLPAWSDNDSQNSPIVNVTLDSTGTKTLIYSGDVSSPEGDAEDWIAFTSASTSLFVSMECGGDRSIKADLLENTNPTGVTIPCGEPMKMIDIHANTAYLVHLEAEPSSGGVQYTTYTITIMVNP